MPRPGRRSSAGTGANRRRPCRGAVGARPRAARRPHERGMPWGGAGRTPPDPRRADLGGVRPDVRSPGRLPCVGTVRAAAAGRAGRHHVLRLEHDDVERPLAIRVEQVHVPWEETSRVPRPLDDAHRQLPDQRCVLNPPDPQRHGRCCARPESRTTAAGSLFAPVHHRSGPPFVGAQPSIARPHDAARTRREAPANRRGLVDVRRERRRPQIRRSRGERQTPVPDGRAPGAADLLGSDPGDQGVPRMGRSTRSTP